MRPNLNSNLLVKAEHISMSFDAPKFRYDTLKEKIVGLFKKDKNSYTHIDVLNDVSFEIKKGESLGVIGRNGAGKSTLLRIVAGVYKPTEGHIQSRGKIVLLNLGSGFDVEASAEENVYINAALLGFSHKETKEKIDSIFDFAELQAFRKMPIKNFSSGMISRLGFAIAINISPDLMLVDEVLSVGDNNFKQKCINKIFELKNKGVSFLFVSHGLEMVKKICEKTLWIEKTKIVQYGDSNYVCNSYLNYYKNLNDKQEKIQPKK